MNSRNLLKTTLFGVAVALVATSASADTVRLRFHTYYGTEMDDIAKKMQEMVREESDGSMRIQYFRGGELVDSDQFVEATASGTIDVAYGVGSYWPGQVDIANIEAGLPGAWTSADEAREVFEQLNPILEEAYAEKGVTLIGRGFGSNYDLLTKEPVDSLEDVKGAKVRATGQMAKVLDDFDVNTVFLPAEELYVGLSTGVIDGVLYGGPVEYEQLKFNEVATNYTFLNLLNPGWTDTIIVNSNVWEKLSEEQQSILKKAVDQYSSEIHQWLEDGNARVIEEGDGFTYKTLPEEDSRSLAQAAQKLWEAEAAKSDRAAEAIEILRENAKEQGRL